MDKRSTSVSKAGGFKSQWRANVLRAASLPARNVLRHYGLISALLATAGCVAWVVLTS